MSPRRLSGWEPAEVTTYEYEGGRLVRSVTVREPEYPDGEVARLLGLWRAQQEPRGSHGHPLRESMSRSADPANRDGEWRYVVPPPSVDFAQQAIDAEIDRYQRDYPNVNLSSLRFRVERKPR